MLLYEKKIYDIFMVNKNPKNISSNKPLSNKPLSNKPLSNKPLSNKPMNKPLNKPKKGGSGNGRDTDIVNEIYDYLSNTSSVFDNSKIFAGLMLLIMNISSKYVKFKLSPSIESFFKNSFGMELLVFILLWIGTKNLLLSLAFTAIFIIVFDFLLNEESQFSILPESFTQYYNGLNNGSPNVTISEEEIKNAKRVLQQARDQML